MSFPWISVISRGQIHLLSPDVERHPPIHAEDSEMIIFHRYLIQPYIETVRSSPATLPCLCRTCDGRQVCFTLPLERIRESGCERGEKIQDQATEMHIQKVTPDIDAHAVGYDH